MSKPDIKAVIEQTFTKHKVDNPELQKALIDALKEIVDYDRISSFILEEFNKSMERSFL